MDFDDRSVGDDPVEEKKESAYLNTADVAALVGVSATTISRYRSEFAAYLNPFTPPGGGRGYKPTAVELFKVIQEMKARRASWFEIKQTLEERFAGKEPGEETLGARSFRHSLETIRRAQLTMANELFALLREVNHRLDKLEKNVRLHRTRKDEDLSARPESRKDDVSLSEPLFPNNEDAEEPSM
ncbi:hypothetical protein CEE37_00080 [candidate division LCP-89 bacterium B3_LCP]|uniref:HTH merR-type domain-containing protein n=1 Tax=candidate division LCP-89 bacterium B3_LCP TaxID=2012998 RepID=A0A532V4I1_UNCL8|nr:MAG: hypothetical protein CEE37_00080 [candidate division LCP-89 bacterium B3_LCP]